jgi:prepilin-type N-terminal cleavage/methylation domain-containing protein
MISKRTTSRRQPAGFTVMELMVVVAIMALLATMTLMGFRYAQNTSMRNRTTAFLRAISSSLENYHTEFGEYPRPKRPQETGEFGKKMYPIGGALMLYQALSGDGDNEIDIAAGTLGASDGKVEGQNEINHVMMKEMPVEMRKRDTVGWFVADGFGHPFQYEVPSASNKVRYGQASNRSETQTINTTYDLWSFGEDDMHTTGTGLEAKKNDMISAKWIKNW